MYAQYRDSASSITTCSQSTSSPQLFHLDWLDGGGGSYYGKTCSWGGTKTVNSGGSVVDNPGTVNGSYFFYNFYSLGTNRRYCKVTSYNSDYVLVGLSTSDSFDNSSFITSRSAGYFYGNSSMNCITSYSAPSAESMSSQINYDYYVHAKFRRKYTISFNSNGGSTTPSNKTALAGVPFTLPSSVGTKSGYKCVGWSTNSSATTATYSLGAQVPESAVNASVTYYAVWQPITYELDINGNLDGEVSGDITGYGSFDLYINGTRVAENVQDFCQNINSGSSYEIKNIVLANDKEYIGVYANNDCTTAGSLTGTLQQNTVICLKFRTKTWVDYAASSYASGSGTKESPYIIKTPQQLAKLAKIGQSQEVTGHYKLGANIDLSAHEWTPIGVEQTYRFQGIFDGNMYTIKNITSSMYYSYGGLFATIVGSGVVKNLIMSGGTIKAGGNVGAIAGLADNGGIVTNCIVENLSVTGTENVGGIAGWSWNSNLLNNIVKGCSLKGSCAGTIFGLGQGGGGSKIIDNGAYSNTISATNAGVLYGKIDSSAYTVTGCYGQGTVNGTIIKQMHGGYNAWSNWSYSSSSLNGGYPIQKTLFHLGGITGSQSVYNYLTENLKFSVVG